MDRVWSIGLDNASLTGTTGWPLVLTFWPILWHQHWRCVSDKTDHSHWHSQFSHVGFGYQPTSGNVLLAFKERTVKSGAALRAFDYLYECGHGHGCRDGEDEVVVFWYHNASSCAIVPSEYHATWVNWRMNKAFVHSYLSRVNRTYPRDSALNLPSRLSVIIGTSTSWPHFRIFGEFAKSIASWMDTGSKIQTTTTCLKEGTEKIVWEHFCT